ncbi:MAG: ATP-binding protein [Rhodoglobus sp.]
MAVSQSRVPRGVSVRARSTAAAIAVVLVSLVIGSLGLLVVLRESAVRAAVSTATARAHDVATELEADGAITSGMNLTPSSSVDDTRVQLLLAGEVVAASPAVSGWSAMTSRVLTAGQVVELLAQPPGVREVGPFVGVALGVGDVEGVDTVVVRQSYASGDEAVGDAAEALALGVPLMVAVVGFTSYRLTGRALGPVEAIRRRTEQISQADEEARIEVPSSGDEIALLAETLNGMLERLHTSRLSQVRFVADASHELRSPLAAIRTELDVACRAPQTNDWVRTAEVIAQAEDRMQRLVDDLLILTRTQETSAADRTDAVDLDAVVEEVGFALIVPEGVSVRVSTTPVQVPGSAHELTRAVRNLAENAARHAREQIRLSVHADGAEAVIEVEDDGAGIPAAASEQIFERFTRLDTSRERASGGAGLGLAIVRGIATAHAGSVVVGASDLGGARFTLTLPAPVEAPAVPNERGHRDQGRDAQAPSTATR